MIKIAIATNGGHVSRALDFYHAEGKYFIIGKSTAWTHVDHGTTITDDNVPETPQVTDYKLHDVIALKRVDNTYLVIPSSSGTIQYRNQNWKIIQETISTTVATPGVTQGATVVPVQSIVGMTVGSKLRINNQYEGIIVSLTGTLVTLDTPAPAAIAVGSPVLGGALIEGAKYVYVECYLNYDSFPVTDATTGLPLSYRQIGLCTKVTPNTEDILKSAAYTTGGTTDEYTSLGILEILDNRVPSTRDINQRELISLIVEF